MSSCLPCTGRIRLAAWLAAATLAGCAPALSSAPRPASPMVAPTAFDGSYQGVRTPDVGCGFAGPVGYEVAGDSIWQPTRTAAHALDGAVEPDGQFRMAAGTGDHVVTGRIAGDHLTATDSFPQPHYKHERNHQDLADTGCTAQIDAHRVAAGRKAGAD